MDKEVEDFTSILFIKLKLQCGRFATFCNFEICVYQSWSKFVFTNPGFQYVFTDSDRKKNICWSWFLNCIYQPWLRLWLPICISSPGQDFNTTTAVSTITITGTTAATTTTIATTTNNNSNINNNNNNNNNNSNNNNKRCIRGSVIRIKWPLNDI